MIGAREHYAVPRALDRRSRLLRFYTDVWAGPVLRLGRYGPAICRSAAARSHAGLPRRRVVSFASSSMRTQLADRLRRIATGRPEEQYLRYIEEGRRFALRVNRQIERDLKREVPGGFFGYHTGSLETLQMFQSRGVPTVVDQMDPARLMRDIMEEESKKRPGWQLGDVRIPEEYFSRIEDEWRCATRIVVNSEWSREALIQQGVPAGKLSVVPLCYEPPRDVTPKSSETKGRLTVLWIGNVTLLKGIPYLIEAARVLVGQSIRFLVAGQIAISADAVRSAPDNVEFVGPITRDMVDQLYRSADVFVLPTLSDGFGITQLEAMAHGLPVVVTPNCGRVVTDGVDGVIVPAADSVALAAALEKLSNNRDQLRDMSREAVLTSRKFTLERVSNELITVLDSMTLTTTGRGPGE